jgi:EAL domain-containing protein (putative c-di-GMP-specific phosphodiesterase class I)
MLIRFADKRHVQTAIIEAENDRTIGQIDLWALRKAIDIIRKDNLPGLIAVNLSPVTIEREFDELMELFAVHEFLRERLVLEMTETAPILEAHTMETFSRLVKLLGVQLALDDYGRGFCDAARALLIQPHFIKLPKEGHSGWRNAPHGEWEVLLEHSRFRNIKLVAERVESEADVAQVTQMGFDYGQGFHYKEERSNLIPINLTAKHAHEAASSAAS